MTPRKVSKNYLGGGRIVEGPERFYAYVDVVSYLHSAYATDGKNAKTAAKVETYIQSPEQTAVSLRKLSKIWF